MKLFAPVFPYLAVSIGLFWFQNAWIALLGFHLAIVVPLLFTKTSIPVRNLFKSSHTWWLALCILLSGSSGISLYLFRKYFGVVPDLSAQLEAYGLTQSTWLGFIGYFVLINPLVEEYFWRGYLGSPAKGFFRSDFAYAGFHALVLAGKMQTAAVVYCLVVLILAGWFWRQIARQDQGLLAPVLGHMAADLTILLAVYWMSM
jgi:membrane protease YdiL (CAAX protease family)